MIGPAYTQVAIKTEKATGKLKWIRAERIERTDAETLKEEQNAYQEKFAEELDKLMEEREKS